MGSGLTALAALVCLAQAPPAVPDLPVSIERIQKELAKPVPPKPERSQLVFRVTIEARPMKMRDPWDPANDTIVPAYVRPRMPLYHYEFLMAVTPLEFRAGVLYPISINVMPGVEKILEAIRQARRRREEERARREVDEALERLLEARKKNEK
jgi:hypothetical protein